VPDFVTREAEYFARTAIFPIGHMLVVRADVDQAARSLYKAFSEAKQVALAGLADAPALRYTMPFLLDTLERQHELFGDNPWPYGIAANRKTLDAFAEYLVEQVLAAQAPDMAELFAPSTRVESRI
jgi:4,5-dihydroxyphthalate decarboxylase